MAGRAAWQGVCASDDVNDDCEETAGAGVGGLIFSCGYRSRASVSAETPPLLGTVGSDLRSELDLLIGGREGATGSVVTSTTGRWSSSRLKLMV